MNLRRILTAAILAGLVVAVLPRPVEHYIASTLVVTVKAESTVVILDGEVTYPHDSIYVAVYDSSWVKMGEYCFGSNAVQTDWDDTSGAYLVPYSVFGVTSGTVAHHYVAINGC